MAKKTKECPFCMAEVKKENLSRHLLKAHGELGEEEFRTRGLQKPLEAGERERPKRGEEKRAALLGLYSWRRSSSQRLPYRR